MVTSSHLLALWTAVFGPLINRKNRHLVNAFTLYTITRTVYRICTNHGNNEDSSLLFVVILLFNSSNHYNTSSIEKMWWSDRYITRRQWRDVARCSTPHSCVGTLRCHCIDMQWIGFQGPKNLKGLPTLETLRQVETYDDNNVLSDG